MCWRSVGSTSTAPDTTVCRLPRAIERGLGLDITVVAPTYQRADRLARLVTALEGQQHPADRFEVVVVDDASTDHTSQVLDAAVARGAIDLRPLRMERNGGPAPARNRGWRSANGSRRGVRRRRLHAGPDVGRCDGARLRAQRPPRRGAGSHPGRRRTARRVDRGPGHRRRDPVVRRLQHRLPTGRARRHRGLRRGDRLVRRGHGRRVEGGRRRLGAGLRPRRGGDPRPRGARRALADPARLAREQPGGAGRPSPRAPAERVPTAARVRRGELDAPPRSRGRAGRDAAPSVRGPGPPVPRLAPGAAAPAARPRRVRRWWMQRRWPGTSGVRSAAAWWCCDAGGVRGGVHLWPSGAPSAPRRGPRGAVPRGEPVRGRGGGQRLGRRHVGRADAAGVRVHHRAASVAHRRQPGTGAGPQPRLALVARAARRVHRR